MSCPRAAINTEKQKSPPEPFGLEALTFTKELIMQREVDVEVEGCDKGGNFIGWLFIDSKNMAISLVEVRLRPLVSTRVCVWFDVLYLTVKTPGPFNQKIPE